MAPSTTVDVSVRPAFAALAAFPTKSTEFSAACPALMAWYWAAASSCAATPGSVATVYMASSSAKAFLVSATPTPTIGIVTAVVIFFPADETFLAFSSHRLAAASASWPACLALLPSCSWPCFASRLASSCSRRASVTCINCR